MNAEMWLDLTTAVRGRVAASLSEMSNRMQAIQAGENQAEAMQAEVVQIEADMNRLWQSVRFMTTDQFEESYNVLSLIGQPPGNTAQAETPAEAG